MAFAYKKDELFIRDNGNYRLFKTDKSISAGVTTGVWYQFCGSWSFASRTFRTYINGTLAGTYITPGRKLQTDGFMVLGDHWDPIV